MTSRHRYGNILSFVDFLFILLLTYITIVILMLMIVNPEKIKRTGVDPKADYQIVMMWDDESDDDVDLWVRDPYGNLVSFVMKSAGQMFLDKDDLGQINDTVHLSNGQRVVTYINREVVSIRGWIPDTTGEYTVNVHLYRHHEAYPQTVTIELIRVNPYAVLLRRTVTLSRQGEEITVFNFILGSHGAVTSSNEMPHRFVTSKLRSVLEQFVGPEGARN